MIVIDGTPLDNSHKHRGIGRFVSELLQGLQALDAHRGLDIRVMRYPGADTSLHPQFPAWTPPRKFLQSGRTSLRTLATAAVVRQLPQGTLFHATEPAGLAIPPKGKLLATCHDLIPQMFPDRYLQWKHEFGIQRILHQFWMPHMLRRAARVITDSQEVAEVVHALAKVPTANIQSIPLGAPQTMTALSPTEIAQQRQRHQWPAHFVLTVGAVDWRKDIATAIRACGRLGERVTLVHAGKLWDNERASLQELAAQQGAQFLPLGFVRDDQLPYLYGAAAAYLFPSLAEGFGLPLLEAMAYHCPVIAAQTSCLPEVGGDAVLWHAPGDDQALAAHIQSLLDSPHQRNACVRSGAQRVLAFPWKNTAQGYLKVYQELHS